MKAIASTSFQVIYSPHQGKIISIDQLDYYTPNLCTNQNTNVPLISDSCAFIESVGEVMFKGPFLMGLFPMPSPSTTNVALVNMISYVTNIFIGSYDLWVVPNPSEVESYGATMPLSPTNLLYSMI